MDLELITDPQALAALKPEWEDLLARCSHATPFATHEWVTTWWKHFGRRGALRVVCARDAGRLVGIAPLCASPLRVRGLPFFRCLEVIGGQESDYKDFLLDHERRWEATEALLRFCREEIGGWHLLIMRGVHQESPSNYLLPVLGGRLGLAHGAMGGAVCPYLPLAGSGPDVWAEYRRRGVVREYVRKRNRLLREQEAAIRFCSGTETVPAMEEFLRLHRLAWRGRGGSRAITSAKLEDFHRDLAQAYSGTDRLLVPVLEAGAQSVAVRYYHVLERRVFEYLTGFDPKHRKSSPGAVLTMAVADHLTEQGFEELDFMRGDEPYKFNFTRLARTTATHVVARSRSLLRRYLLVEALSASS